MFKILRYLKKMDWLFVLLGVIFIVTQVWLDLKMPDYTMRLTEMVSSTSKTLVMREVLKNGGFMLLCAFFSMICSFICGFLFAWVASSVAKNLRENLFFKTTSFSSNEMKKFSVPSLITRTTNDVTQVQMFISVGLQILIKAPILAIWAITKISATSIEWTMATLICVGVIVLCIGVIVSLVLPKFKKIQKLTDNLNDSARENISGVRVIRAFNAEEYQQNKFKKANNLLTKNQLFTTKTTGLLMPVLNLCMNGLTLAIYWIGALIINKAAFAERAHVIGNMTAYTQYALQVVMSFILLVAIFIILPRAIVSAKRINEVLDTKNSIVDGSVCVDDGTKGQIEFKNVSFKYEDGAENVLNNITFTAKKGETIAIVGATGSGKTTLIDLMARLNDASSGEVLVDGINVKQYKFENLQDKIAIVSQKACLFKGDIKDNITYGTNKDIDLKKIDLALDVSQADFVKDLADGISSPVAQGGTNFSGGQKQRLNIARAVYKDAEIIIFDDSFSALDYKTDLLVRQKIKENLKDKTIIIVAQRIGTIRNADKILVLDNGKIVGQGNHQQLLKTCPVYKQIALSQLNKEEL